MTTTVEPVYTPVLPRTPARLRGSRLRPMFEAGGRRLLWAVVREELLRVAGGRARSPEEVAALRAWVDLEHEPSFLHWLEKFEGR